MQLHLNRRHMMSLSAAVAASGVTGLLSNTAYAAALKPSGKVDMVKLLEPGKMKDMVEGDANAPVTIVEYASLTCSHCADFFEHTLPTIREKYIKTGKVRLVFREFAFDKLAQAGFMLARCAPEDRYFPLVQVLFEKQAEWAFVQDSLPPLRQIAGLAGFNDQTFEACLRDQNVLNNVNSSFERGKEFNVTATPTFFINGDKYEGALTVDQMSSVIDSYL